MKLTSKMYMSPLLLWFNSELKITVMLCINKESKNWWTHDRLWNQYNHYVSNVDIGENTAFLMLNTEYRIPLWERVTCMHGFMSKYMYETHTNEFNFPENVCTTVIGLGAIAGNTWMFYNKYCFEIFDVPDRSNKNLQNLRGIDNRTYAAKSIC